MMKNITRVLSLLICFAGAPAITLADEAQESNASRDIYLVRHAEKAKDGTKDPQLTQAGRERAELLAELLKDKNIKAVYSSDYQRTRQTAEPLINALGTFARIYDPRNLPIMVDRLGCGQGNVLVVGHSNTTPQLVRLLGGEAEDMDESVYNRLYQLTIKDGKVTTKLRLFGAE